MRNDLSRACVHCMLRLPEADLECPRCGLPTKAPRMAVGRIGRVLRAETTSSPLRDALLYLPAAALIVVAVAAAVYGTYRFVVAIDFRGGLLVAGALVALATCLTCAGTIAALVWGIWSGLVLGVFRLFGAKQEELQLRTAPLGAAPRASRVGETTLERAWRWLTARVSLGNFVILVLAAELCAELFFTRHPFGRRTVEGVSLTVGALLFQAVVGFMLSMPLALLARACIHVEQRLRLLRRGRADRAPGAGPGDLEILRVGRAAARGAVLGAGRTVVAPLSGRRCLGFRLVGRIGCMQIDDAEIGELLVRAEGEEVAVRAGVALLAVPEPTESPRALGAEQMRRIVELFAARTMDVEGDVSLGETILEEGTAVRVHGAESEEPAPGATYRGGGARRVLSDADGKPVLVEAVSSAAP